jgi:hypothetical protein
MRKTLLLVFIHGFKVCLGALSLLLLLHCLQALGASPTGDDHVPANFIQIELMAANSLLQGGDDTFGTFPEHLRALISHALPKIDVVAITYPKFDTRGELKDCVERFREWYEKTPCILVRWRSRSGHLQNDIG